MGGEKGDLERLIGRIDELINVMKILADDLSDVSRRLKAIIPAGKPVAEAPSSIAMIRESFPEDLREMLNFEDVGDYIRVVPKRFLGSDNFAKIASIVRSMGGEYVSAGRDSHFRLPKRE